MTGCRWQPLPGPCSACEDYPSLHPDGAATRKNFSSAIDGQTVTSKTKSLIRNALHDGAAVMSRLDMFRPEPWAPTNDS